MIAGLSEWLADLAAQPAGTIAKPIQVTGSWDKHAGPRWPRASIEVIVEPASGWDVSVELPSPPGVEEESFLRQAVLGVLDVLATRPPRPLLNVRVRIVGALFDPVESSERAFRLAGRDAGEKILAAAG